LRAFTTENMLPALYFTIAISIIAANLRFFGYNRARMQEKQTLD